MIDMPALIITASSIFGAALILTLIYLLVLVRPRARKPENTALLCDYAHRGLHGDGVPENSLEAFELACKNGYGIELDVQLSKDGKVMVFHDYTLFRMTGADQKLCELDAKELCELSLAKTEQKIPTFEEVLALVDGRVPILVELKGENTTTTLCPKVAEILKNYGGSYCIESFNPLLVKDIKKYLPDAYCGLLYTNVCRDKKKKSALNIIISGMMLNFLARPDFIAYNKLDRNSFLVKLTTKFYHAPKFSWTIKGEDERKAAHGYGEHPIFEKQ